MKNILLLTCGLLLALPSFAQIPSGKIEFEETIKMEVRLEGEAAQYASMLPREQQLQKVLYFNTEAALYTSAPAKKAAEDEAAAADGNVRMRIRMNAPEDKIYIDLKGGKTVEQREFMTRKFLITGELTKPAWKLTGRQKTVLEYPCQEAVWITDKDTVTAWFTTAIPVSAGPDGWTGLPGMILEGQRNSRVTIRAVAVTPGQVDEKILVQPKEGKKVSKEEFKTIVAAKRKEMGVQSGGNGNVIIRIQNN